MAAKILLLHGSQQNVEVLKTRLGRTVSRLSKFANLFFTDSPHELPLKEGDDAPMRTWYRRGDDGDIIVVSIQETLDAIKSVWDRDGPFDGIFGFSQGGIVAALIAMFPDRFHGLKFVICAGAPFSEQLFSKTPKILSTTSISSQVKSLHFAGKQDTVVPISSSTKLASLFADAQFVEHDQGHCIPSRAESVNVLLSFVESMTAGKDAVSTPRMVRAAPSQRNGGSSRASNPPSEREKTNGLSSDKRSGKDIDSTRSATVNTGIGDNSLQIPVDGAKTGSDSTIGATLRETNPESAPEVATTTSIVPSNIPVLCNSDSNAEQQRDEMEALQAMYADGTELTIVQPAPSGRGQPCAVYLFLLPEAGPSSPYSASALNGVNPAHWKGQLGIRLSMPAGYPEDVGATPKIAIETGTLSMMDFPSVLRRSLLSAVVSIY
jgi:predicted esterase